MGSFSKLLGFTPSSFFFLCSSCCFCLAYLSFFQTVLQAEVKWFLMEEASTIVSSCAAIDAYVRKGVGIDLVLKSLLGIVRLFSIYSRSEETRGDCARLASSIINCRMLANHFRYAASFYNAMSIFKKKEGPFLSWVCLAVSFFFRSLEQVFGDLNYYQMVFMHHWGRRRLSLGYWFFKSLSLTCGFFSELVRIRVHMTSHQWKSRTPQERSEYMRASAISIIRYISDMAVYYQWIPWYNPYKTLQYIFGSTAGILGVYVLWRETQAERAASLKAEFPSVTTSSNGHSKKKMC